MKPTERADMSREELMERLVCAEERIQMLEEILGCVPGFVFNAVGLPGTPQHRCPFVGPQFVALTGYSVEEWATIPDLWASLLHPDDKGRVTTARTPQASKDLPVVEYRLVGKDGRVIWLESHVIQVRDDAGALVGLRGAAVDITARKKSEQERAELLEEAQRLGERLDGLISSVPGLVWESWFQPDEAKLRSNFVSEHVTAMTGYSREEYLAMEESWFALMHPDDQERMRRESSDIVARGEGSAQFRWITKDGRTIWVENHLRSLVDEHGEPLGLRGVSMDITERKQIEREHADARLREEVIRMHEARLEELSTPLIPINEEVMVMPLIGFVDSVRAERVIQALLEGVGKSRARFAILDITGVPSVDSATADALTRAAKAVQLLGAEVVLTGIRPEVAQTLISLGTDLGRIVTRGSLQSGIAYAISRR